MADFEIECGVRSLKGNFLGRKGHHINRIKSLQKYFRENFNKESDIITYNGIKSPYGGGRNNSSRFDDLVRLIDDINSEGLRFNLALNGGLTFKNHFGDELDQERQKFEKLSENNSRFGVKNGVTITAPILYTILTNEFPDLDIYSSCIQFLNPHDIEDYEDKLAMYDKVIPLNQHTTYDFLKHFSDKPDKLMIFLNHHCGRYSLFRCYIDHYVMEEMKSSTSENKGQMIFNEQSFNTIKSQIPAEHHGCDSGMLTSRPDDLKKLVEMGIRSFKVPRDVELKKEHVDLLGSYMI